MSAATSPSLDRRTADLLSLAVHEFRTPATVVSGYLRMLAREQLGPLNERQKSLVGEAEKSCARLSALVGQVNELAQLASGAAPLAQDDVALDALVDEVADTVTEGQDRGVTMRRECGAAPAVVSGDRRRLRDVVHSLLLAVLREQSTPVTVTVHTGTVALDGSPMAALAIGPADSAHALIASPPLDGHFNDLRGGLGLALPIARLVVDRLGGRLWSSASDRNIGAVAMLLPLKENRS